MTREVTAARSRPDTICALLTAPTPPSHVSAGSQAMRDMPHARFDCLVHKFPAQPMPDKCKVACDKCYCWLCDDAWTNCKDWSAHCVCDGTPPWATERLKLKQKAQASKLSTVPAADVAARFAAAVAAADGSAASASADDQQQDQQETDQKDEENEELFSEYQPRHLVGGQPHPDPIVETTSLSFAELPKIKHTFSAPLKRIHEPTSAANPYGGSLSKAQLETVDPGRARTLSALAYSQFDAMLRSAAFRAGVHVHDVNPAYTSVMGAVNTAQRRGISVHLGAACTIARRGLGLSERPIARQGQATVPARHGGHVTFALPERNRAKHVWSQWSGVRRRLSAALREHYRCGAAKAAAPPLSPALRTARTVRATGGSMVGPHHASRQQHCSADATLTDVPF